MLGINLYPPSLRAWGAIGVLTAWVGSLAWLAVRVLGQSESSTMTSQASLRLGPAAAWFGVYAGATQVGSAGITLDTLSPGYRILQTVTLELPVDSGLVRATRRTETRLAGTFELLSVNSQYSRAGRQSDWSLVQQGDTLIAHHTVGLDVARGVAHFGGPVSPLSAFPYRLGLSGALAEGKVRTQTLLMGWPPAGRSTLVTVGKDSLFHFADSATTDPATGRLKAAHIDSTLAYPVVFDGPTGPERLWIDRRGAVAGMETVFGVRWIRNDFELAVQEFQRSRIVAANGIRAALPTLTLFAAAASPDTVTTERRYQAQHADGRPIDRALLALLAGGRQVVRGDTIIVGPEVFATRGGGFEDFSYDPMIQADAREIAALASDIREHGPTREILAGLAATLHRLVRVDTSVTAPLDALDALRSGRAQPDGFVRLYVAVLRSARVPSRLVIGVSPLGTQLRTHAWAEVREARGTGWLAIDPIMNRIPASTSLIRLSFGGSSHPEEMLSLLADVKFTVVGHSENHP